jgi:F-type H+-transporting ATPase subunit delta
LSLTMPRVVASRYARALADVVAPTGEYRKVLGELKDFYEAYRSSAELREICNTPALPLVQKMKVLEAIVARLGGSPVTRNFLRVLLVHYRLALLEEVIEAFRKISYERMGVVQVKVSSAVELSVAERELLRARFGELTRRQAEVEFHLDQQLIGGVVAQVGSTVYDGSVRGRLERIREQLTAR